MTPAQSRDESVAKRSNDENIGFSPNKQRSIFFNRQFSAMYSSVRRLKERADKGLYDLLRYGSGRWHRIPRASSTKPRRSVTKSMLHRSLYLNNSMYTLLRIPYFSALRKVPRMEWNGSLWIRYHRRSVPGIQNMTFYKFSSVLRILYKL